MTTDRVGVTGTLVRVDGADWYRIDGLERMEPFLMSVVSDSDLWMFVSSAGPLTAGRIDADRAVLPYETDDRLHRAVDVSGPVTLVVRDVDGQRQLWQPFARHVEPGCRRVLRKQVLGDALVLEEEHAGWGLAFRSTWQPSRAYGWVRTSELVDLRGVGGSYEVLDGLLDVMPAGVDAATEQLTSNLVDAYKRSETGRWGTVAIYTLETLITDRAEPAESLSATVVWSTGFEGARLHLDERVIDSVRAGRPHPTSELLTGRRGAYLRHGRVDLGAAMSASWMLVVDTGLGQAALLDTIRVADDPESRKLVTEDARAGSERLAALLAGADGRQHTGDPIADAHHLSNVLFNCMRGGVFPHGYLIPVADLLDFLAVHNLEVSRRHGQTLAAQGPSVSLDVLHRLATDGDDPDLLRLVLEYLPLTFSRRHGDPSRPWNRFSIRVTTDEGDELLNYEGNWRDIFQNWEALLRSYPRYLPHAVAKFLNASTVDGHNAYRISRAGIDWEVPDPHDPWGNIGYWGDHQIVYLHRLLQGWQATEPEGPLAWLQRPIFTYADVPYRLSGHEEMLRDPRATITFDREAAAAVDARVARLGADGRLVHAGDALVRVTLAEKLLVPALAKLSSYVAGGGIWMNTQRPEWNDANNALAGHGLSMVTLYQLERYLGFLTGLLVDDREAPVVLSRDVRGWLEAITAALEGGDPEAAATDPVARRALLDALGAAGAAHREHLDAGFDTTPEKVEVAQLSRLLVAARVHLQATIGAARREDGLYHAYNLVSFPSDETAVVEHLPAMLEGQVAVLGTTALDAHEVADLVDALFASPLYRADQDSFLLYPVPDRASFLDRNTVAEDQEARHPVLTELARGPAGILQRDASGRLHFRADLTNAAALRAALEAAGCPPEEQAVVQEVYEELFDHHAFTGRSGGMHGYEGIGSIYWHMVAKLLLAVQERAIEVEDGGDVALHDRLVAAYRRLRDGLGFRKDPATYGAFPTDCYSHTPAHAGAQQPGMTGQVKEEVLTRAGELGLRLAEGRLRLGTPLLPAAELWTDLCGGQRGFDATTCATPLRVVVGEQDELRITHADGDVRRRAGRSLTAEETAAVLERDASIAALEFTVSTTDGATVPGER